MKRSLSSILALTAVLGLAACGGGEGEAGGEAGATPDTTAAATAPMGDTMGMQGGSQPPYVNPEGGAVAPAGGATGTPAPGDTVYGDAGPAGPSGPGGHDTLVTKP